MPNQYLKNRVEVENRYSKTSVYIDDSVKPGARRYGLWVYPAFRTRPELGLEEGSYYRYVMTQVDIGRLDLVSWKFYQNVSWWWVIALCNGIKNQLTDMVAGNTLLIPSKDSVVNAFH